ncbi:tyrosine-type recombinase/integrase [Streptomyces cylindrosporus]|uniref:Tyrosine-type recombinase/integrase n=1 Tax=Streptomyces cylindrosporus TaxID=2927583 RepID=A0ABS9YPL0_9ACTN|nr:tyrosine-type recombinase/integrase [Streptomyces cylindrosporus]MCI3279198.1 tyrosine-type recombinase/integrase [Streptomyces cylindrosporus]
MSTEIEHRSGNTLDRSVEQQLLHLRDVLGQVAPRDPRTRRLGPRCWRLELLAEACAPETFRHVVSWLSSTLVSSVASKQAYADDIRNWAAFLQQEEGIAQFALEDVTPFTVRSYRQHAEERKSSPRTIKRRMDSLSSLFTFTGWATGQPILNPVTKFDKPKIDPNDYTTATPVLEVPEFQAVVTAAATPREALVPVLIYTLAGRVSECCSAGLHSLQNEGGQRKLDLRRKGGKGRVFTLPPRLCELLDAATAGRTSGALLLDDQDRAMDRHAIDRMLNRLGQAAGVLPGREVTPHVLRASKLTHMHDEGVPLEDIQQYADHAHIQTTLRYIRQRDDEALKAKHAAAAVKVYDHLVDRFV